MKRFTLLAPVCTALLLFVTACQEEITPVEDVSLETSVVDQEMNNDSENQKNYDLSVLDVECKEMLKFYEDLQIEIKEAREAANSSPENAELQNEYLTLVEKNATMMQSDTMVNCSHVIDFQHALLDLQAEYSLE